MAAIIPNQKDGKTVSYKFKACLGRNECGKQIFRCKTWKIPEGVSPAKTRKAAEKEAAAWEREIKSEYEKDLCDPGRIKAREIERTHTEFSKFALDTWFPLYVKDGSHKHTTVDFYRHTANRVAEHFKGKELQSITPLDIQRFLSYLRTDYRTKQGKPISDKTVRHSYCVLVLIFSFAVEQELLSKNPMDKVDCPKLAKKRVEAFTQEQASDFLSALSDCPLDFRCMMYLLITAGLRRGELLGLQWRDIDNDRLTLEVCRNVTYSPDRGIVIDTPKTDTSIRIVPLLPFVAAILKEYRETACPDATDTTLLFPGENDTAMPRAPAAVTQRVKRFMRLHGLPDMSPHDLRHPYVKLKTKKYLSLFPKNEPHAEKGSCMRLISDYMMDSKMSFTL